MTTLRTPALNGLTDHAQGGLQIAIRGLEGIGINGQRCAALWALDSLLQAQAIDDLHVNLHHLSHSI